MSIPSRFAPSAPLGIALLSVLSPPLVPRALPSTPPLEVRRSACTCSPRSALQDSSIMLVLARRSAALNASSSFNQRLFSSEIFRELRFQGIDTGSGRLSPVSPDAFTGKAVLVVNTASYCGYTPQLKSLVALAASHRDRGFEVVATPCNDFGAQEPDAEPAVYKLYREKWGVDFPVTEKCGIVTAPHPFYQAVAKHLGDAGAPTWNFAKFLFNKQHELVGIFPPAMDPLDPQITSQVEEVLR